MGFLSAIRRRFTRQTRAASRQPEAPPQPAPAAAPASLSTDLPSRALHVVPGDRRGVDLNAHGGNLNEWSMLLWRKLLAAGRWTQIVDVGANYGEMLVMPTLPPDADILAFEPAPAIRACLERNLRAAGIVARVSGEAVSDAAGEAQLALDPDWSGTTRLAEAPKAGGALLTVKTVTLEAALGGAAAAAGMRFLLKVDVEGHERQVLAGLLPLLPAFADFAGMIEIHYLDAATKAWLLKHFDLALLSHRVRRLIPVTPGTPERLAEVLADPQVFPQDAALRRRGEGFIGF